jgi:ribonuclease HII
MLQYEHDLMKKGYNLIAGVDEVGLGPVAGPVVAAAVILDLDKAKNARVSLQLKTKVKELEINDSKQLTAGERWALYPMIMRFSQACALGIVYVEEINTIKNIYQCGILARKRAVEALMLRPDYILVDGPIPIDSPDSPCKAIVKGDTLSVSIAAASIVAKIRRDAYMTELAKEFQHYGWDKNMGYGTKAHFTAIKEHGVCPHHRIHLLGGIE